jgi:hypothetical protein
MDNTAIKMFSNTIKYDDNTWIWVKPVCDFFKINYENQTRKIKSDPILANHSTKKSNSLMFGDNYPRLLVDKIGFIRWIQLINPNTIATELRSSFEKYQELVMEFLFGSVEREQKATINYARLKKLRRLKGIINAEIKKCDKSVNGYLTSRLNHQTKLQLK